MFKSFFRTMVARLRYILIVATALTLGTMAWEHWFHQLVIRDTVTASESLLHLFRDAALAFPLGIIAVAFSVHYLSVRRRQFTNPIARAGLLSMLFSVLMAPAVAVHTLIDQLLDSHAHVVANVLGRLGALKALGSTARGQLLAAVNHQRAATPTLFEHSHKAGDLVIHGLRDAFIGQVAVLPLALLFVAAPAIVKTIRARRLVAASPLQRPANRRLKMRLRVMTAFVAALSLALSLQVASASINPLALPAPDVHCAVGSTAPQRTYNVDAINVPITLNRFGVYDPTGFMYVLDSNESAAINLANKLPNNPTLLSNGLQDDLIQPLVIRVNLGDCLTIKFRNDLTKGFDPNCHPFAANPCPAQNGDQYTSSPPPVSIHIHGVAESVSNSGGEVGNNPNSFASPDPTASNHTVTYSVFVDPSLGEGAHVFHSHGDNFELQLHGLFGALVAEPAGSVWLDPFTGQPSQSGSQVMIVPPTGTPFREFVPIYHEVGDQAEPMRRPFPLINVNGVPQALVANNADNDPFTASYAPCTKAINYRSECFMTRLAAVKNIANLPVDESQGYGSYTHGDPSTPIFMAYLGDPMKTRLVNGGTEMAHVHHMHGGAIRWRRNPGADPGNDISGGLEKFPDNQAQSIRLDSQTVQPGESYNLEHECGAGGCQQVPGDFLFHCHIAHHYVSGMWGFYRTFDSLQNGNNATVNGGRSSLTLQPLPGRTPPTAVTSDQLIGKTIPTPSGNKTVVTQATLTDPSTQIAVESLVEGELPPQGNPVDSQDAAVWNWGKTTNALGQPVYLSEPTTNFCWGNFCDSADAGKRLPILFNPNNGRYAWPLLRPHLGSRPPFSPNFHTGAPWLGENVAGTRQDGLCPAGAPLRTYNVTAVSHALQETSAQNGGDVDNNGQLFMLNENVPAFMSSSAPATNFTPLAIRGNVGDCIAVSLSSMLNPKTEMGNDSKVNMHIHFVQFDPQASDGVITGLSFEQSVKPFSTESRTLTSAAQAGNQVLKVTNTNRLQVGEFIAIGQGQADIEFNRIAAITSSNNVTLEKPLANNHPAGESAGVEFVRYRWYPDVDAGTVFWHDHVDGIHSWGHGLFGAFIIEPAGCAYLDPTTGAPVRSGAIVDISCPSTASVGVGQSGSFREIMLWLHNDLRGDINTQGNPASIDVNGNVSPPPAPRPQGCNFGSFNLKAEPFFERVGPRYQNQTPQGTVPFNPPTATTPHPAMTLLEGENTNFNGIGNTQPCPGYAHSQDPYTFSSVTYGDPYTPMLRAYPGDPVVIRTIGLVERVGALRVTGHRFRTERFNANGKLEDTGTTGISERFDYVLDGGAGGPNHAPGDYLYYSTLAKEFATGAWGLFRVFGSQQADLETLPGQPAPPTGPGFPFLTKTGGAPPMATSAGNPCPSTAPSRYYSVAAFAVPLPQQDQNPGGAPPFPPQVKSTGNVDTAGVIYSLASQESAIKGGHQPVVPLVLRANAGDCLQITLRNDLPVASPAIPFMWGSGQTRVGITPALMLFDPQGSYGAAIGYNPDSSVGPGQSYTYKFYADQELGTTVFLNMANQSQQLQGSFGAIVVEPKSSTYSNPDGSTSNGSGLQLDIHGTCLDGPTCPSTSSRTFREMALLEMNSEGEFGRSVMDYYNIFHPLTSTLNYTNDPVIVPDETFVTSNLKNNIDPSEAFATGVTANKGLPAANHFFAEAGDPLRVRYALAVANTQPSVFSFDGHCWPWEPLMPGSQVLCARTTLPSETIDARIIGGAGGPEHSVGDWFFSDHREMATEDGVWGILTACDSAANCGLESLE